MIESLKADYVHPLSKRARLEAGVKTNLISSDNNVLFSLTQNGITTPDHNQSNHFTYHENVNAAYAPLTHTTPKTTLTAGLRAEQTNTSGQQ